MVSARDKIDKIIEDEERGIIGLWPSQYKIFRILKDAPGALSERQIRERYKRRSSLSSELNALIKLGLISREKKGKICFYSIRKNRKEEK